MMPGLYNTIHIYGCCALYQARNTSHILACLMLLLGGFQLWLQVQQVQMVHRRLVQGSVLNYLLPLRSVDSVVDEASAAEAGGIAKCC